jgi:hypothetical protein
VPLRYRNGFIISASHATSFWTKLGPYETQAPTVEERVGKAPIVRSGLRRTGNRYWFANRRETNGHLPWSICRARNGTLGRPWRHGGSAVELPLVVTPDLKYYAYSCPRDMSDLYIVSNLK